MSVPVHIAILPSNSVNSFVTGEVMPKYYVKSGKREHVLQSEYPVLAACWCFYEWKRLRLHVDKTIRVSEIGFDGDHPDHVKDSVLATNFIKSLIAQ